MKTIYLADDDEDDRMLIRLAVEQVINPVRIIELTSGGDLIKLINNQGVAQNPAMIIMDMNMPRLSGLETLAVLKSNDASRQLPVVMLSTTSNRMLVRQAYERGVNAFLEKPINEADFMKLAKAVKACFLNVSDEPTVHSGHQKGNVIVIEDSEDHLFFIRHALHESMPEVQVIEFTDAAAVSEQLGAAWNSIRPAPHLILMDLYLPGRQDGLDLLVDIHQLLVSKNCRSVPIIVFSYGSAEDIRHGHQRSFRWNTVSAPDHTLD